MKLKPLICLHIFLYHPVFFSQIIHFQRLQGLWMGKVTANEFSRRVILKSIRLRLLHLMLSYILVIFTVNAQGPEQKIDNYLSGYQGVNCFSGIVLVASKDSVLFHKAYGMADYEWNIPNTFNTRFRIASLSKSFTAVLVLQYVEKDKIRLDAKISEYLTDYPSPYGDSITIHQLLSHTSGLPHYDAVPGFNPKYTRVPMTSEEYLRFIAGLKLLFHPGTSYHYSSFGYFILGAILEKIGGLPFPELLKNNILKPAGLNETAFDDMVTLRPFMASGYDFDQSGIINCSFEDTYKSVGCGGIISTANDLFKWNQAITSGLILPVKYSKLIFRKYLGPYGYGWILQKMAAGEGGDTITIASHAGSDFGFASYISKNLTDGTSIIILSNLESVPVQKMAADISKLLLNREVNPPVNRQYVQVSQPIYSACAGRYQISSNYHIDVFEERNGLSIQWTGLHTRFLLFPASYDTYFLRETSKEFKFNKNEKGAIKDLSFNDNGTIIVARKIK